MRKETIMKFLFLLPLCLFTFLQGFAQKAKPEPKKELIQGNKAYQEKKYEDAQKSYQQALERNPESFKSSFNLGDALYKKDDYENARKAFSNSLQHADSKENKAKALHNIGNTFLKEKKWEDAIKVYKESLKLNAKEPNTKYNLAYAQEMLKKEQQDNKDNKENKDNKDKDKDKQEDKENKDKDDQKDKDKQDQQDKKDQEDKKDQGDQKDQKDQNEDKKDKEDKRPEPQKSKLTQQEAENLLNALQQEEKKLHDQNKEKEKGAPVKIEKDW